MSRVGVAHPGTQHSWQTALALQEASLLGWYATSFYYKSAAWPDKAVSWLPPSLRGRVERQLRRRRLDELDDRLVRRSFGAELLERPAGRFMSRDFKGRLQYQRNMRFPARIVRVFEREPVDVLWAPLACLDAFKALKTRGVLCVLEQTSGHGASLNRATREEHARHPDFFFGEPAAIGPGALERQREAAELADVIVVGSTFAERTLTENGVDPAKIRVIPYGYDERLFPETRPRRTPTKGRPLEFVYLGRIAAMKGAAYLLEAFRRIDPAKARLTLIGALEIPATTFSRYEASATYLGQVGHWEVPTLLSRADGFIFPSLFEGGGIVLYEAAACALGVIQTDACGDGVRGENGAMVATASVESIVSAVEAALEGDAIERWGEASWNIRGERSWARYRAMIASTARELSARSLGSDTRSA